MEFGPKHYVPVLKVKRGEKAALALVTPDVRANVTPLLEIVEFRPDDENDTVEDHLRRAFDDLAASVAGYARIFLDARELARGDYEEGRVADRIRGFLRDRNARCEEMDLIFDLGPLDELILEGVYSLLDAALVDLPDLTRWRTFTLSGCAFPQHLGGIERNAFELVQRMEWLAWRNRLYTERASLTRLPTFSDAAVQHPSGVEGFEPGLMKVSPSIRYLSGENWVVMKGQSTEVVPGRQQFLEMCGRLVSGELSEYFAGQDHCPACNMLAGRAQNVSQFASNEVSRRLATVHHVTSVVADIRGLVWP